MEANENVSSAKGDWQTARDFAERGLEMSPREANLLGCRAILEYQVGEFEAGGVYLEQLFENVRPSPSNLAAFTTNTVPAVAVPLAAYITGEIARFDQVEAIAQSVVDSPSGFPAALHAARIGLALMAVQRGDEMAAANLYRTMGPLRGTMSPQGPFGPGLAADRLLGLLSQTMGNRDQAASHFEDSMAFCRKAGYRPELAWICYDYAGLLLGQAPGPSTSSERTDSSDRAKATVLLDESLAIASELGMRPLAERVTERLERVHAQPGAAPTYPGGLTEREVEVLRLIAAGKTNSEIAEKLVIAEGTARRHVANIYEKIGSANRVEAAAYANQHGLLEDLN